MALYSGTEDECFDPESDLRTRLYSDRELIRFKGDKGESVKSFLSMPSGNHMSRLSTYCFFACEGCDREQATAATFLKALFYKGFEKASSTKADFFLRITNLRKLVIKSIVSGYQVRLFSRWEGASTTFPNLAQKGWKRGKIFPLTFPLPLKLHYLREFQESKYPSKNH
jgi:hypothetical protein